MDACLYGSVYPVAKIADCSNEVKILVVDTNQKRGRAGLSLAIAYFGTNGYTVSVPLNDTQWYDLIVEKDGHFMSVQCKFTATDDNVISMRSSGGTKGGVYDSILNHTELDYIFCANKNCEMWLIPFEELKKSGNVKTFTLMKTANKYGPKSSTFDTSKFVVTL